MSAGRRYKLLCPIARALDRVGDRWTLLILRDLHAGPARFSDLQTGLTGIAANLLTDRLNQLMRDGLVIRQDGAHGVSLYALTDLGTRTRELLFELALYGARFPPDGDLKRPGNLRTVAVTLGSACQRVVSPQTNFEAELVVDGERFTLTARGQKVELHYASSTSPDVIMATEYEAMIAASEGEMTLSEFMRDHVEIKTVTPGKDLEFTALVGAAMQYLLDRK